MSASHRWTILAALLCVGLGATALGRATAAQQPAPSSSEVTSALLQEVRALRLAMEHSAAVAPRVQLTLARLNIEEQRIAQLAMQLDRARQEVTSLGLSLGKMSDELVAVEAELREATDEKTRRAHEIGIADLKQRMKLQVASESAARGRENDVAQALTIEQNRWNDLNARLDELERLLGPVR